MKKRVITSLTRRFDQDLVADIQINPILTGQLLQARKATCCKNGTTDGQLTGQDRTLSLQLSIDDLPNFRLIGKWEARTPRTADSGKAL